MREHAVDGARLGGVFLTPITHSYDGQPLIWGPGVKPRKLYRRTSAFWKLCALRVAVTSGWFVAIASPISIWFLEGSLAGVVVVLFSLILCLGLIGFHAERNYGRMIFEFRRSWVTSVPTSELHWPRSAVEVLLFGSLETIQRSRALRTGIVNRRRFEQLHELVWMLVTSGQNQAKDAELLENAASEVLQVDRVLAERDTQAAYDEGRQTGTTLDMYSKSLAEELGLFRDFLERPNGH